MTQKSKVVIVGLAGMLAGAAMTLNFSAVADKEASSALPVEELRTFTEVFARIKSDYVEPVEDKKLITEAINGMVSGLDPHSSYLDAEGYKDLQIGTQGEFGGLGIEVGIMEDGFVKVVSPIEDTPAFKAGIKPGDLIIKLDETPVKGMSLNDAVKRMRGKPKTPIRLTVVRKGDTAARLSGDEFTFVLSDMVHVDDAARVAQKILDVFAQPFHILGRELFMTASLGITLYPFDDKDVLGLLRNADVAMYRAKELGRNNYQFYTAQMTAKAVEALALESDLNRALDNDELVLHYQPIIDLNSGALLGMEALVRWQHPQRGMVPPLEFIPISIDRRAVRSGRAPRSR